MSSGTWRCGGAVACASPPRDSGKTRRGQP
jgi:hypothetical protein